MPRSWQALTSCLNVDLSPYSLIEREVEGGVVSPAVVAVELIDGA